MPKKSYIITLENGIRITCFLDTQKKLVERFVIKLEILINSQWTEVERYDTHHGYVHKDILDKNGNKKRTVQYKLLDNKSGSNVAIKDFRENYKIYIERFFND